MVAKTSAKSKNELIEENTVLKSKLKELLSLAKKNEENVGLTHTAMGVFKDDGVYKLVEVKYNPITKQAEVSNSFELARNNKDRALAVYGAKEYLVTKLFKETDKEGL